MKNYTNYFLAMTSLFIVVTFTMIVKLWVTKQQSESEGMIMLLCSAFAVGCMAMAFFTKYFENHEQ